MLDQFLPGARRIIREVLAVRASETVLVITDFDTNPNIALALRNAAAEVGSAAFVLSMAAGKRPGEEVPKLIADAMLASDVILAPTSRTIMHTEAATKAHNKGARILTITGANENTLVHGGIHADFHSLIPVFDRLMTRFTKGNTLTITTCAGTDLSMSICGRLPVACTGICTRPGDKIGFPDAEICISPVEDSVKGTVVVDASSSAFGLCKQPLCMQIEHGRITEMEGGIEKKLLLEDLNGAGHDGAWQICEAAFGLNYMSSVTGNGMRFSWSCPCVSDFEQCKPISN